MSDEITWFVCRGEGYIREPVSFDVLKACAHRYPIFGAQRGEKYVAYDHVLKRHGLGPIRVHTMPGWKTEIRAL